MSMKKDDWMTALVGFLPGVVFGCALMWVILNDRPASIPRINAPQDASQQQQQQKEGQPAPKTGEGESRPSTLAISVANQPAGKAVVVQKATLPSVHWLAVRDMNADGSVGNILGAKRVDKGEVSSVVIDLLRATEPGKKYAVVAFTDNGDTSFDSKVDKAVLDANGKPVVFSFSAQTPVAPAGR